MDSPLAWCLGRTWSWLALEKVARTLRPNVPVDAKHCLRHETHALRLGGEDVKRRVGLDEPLIVHYTCEAAAAAA